MSWIGLDVGGANLKAADGRGWAAVLPFALWREPANLPDALNVLLRDVPAAQRLAVTMTGELCDCFETKADGVRHIISCVQRVAGSRPAWIYLLDGRFVACAAACDEPHLAAASNWHALARFACRYLDGDTGVLFDVGSTTADIVPLVDGKPCPQGWSDTQRLAAGELVYTGVARTPVCAITRSLPWRGEQCSVAAELFATSADAYVLLDCLSDDRDAKWTADGRPLTKPAARARLARMVCADSTTFSDSDAVAAAACVRDAQISLLSQAVCRVFAAMNRPPECVVLAGSGEFLASAVLDREAVGLRRVSMQATLGLSASISAAAHALAVLAAEDING
jgi:probable H4MPT-linked C1 transfer pathway protein